VSDTLNSFPTVAQQYADTICFICGTETFVSDDVGFARVGGNSANGYEVYHISCCKG